MKSKGRAIAQTLAIGVGSLLPGFFIGYFLVFAGFKTPAHSADGQGGLPEFLRILYSLEIAGASALVASAIAIWRLWPRA